MAKTVRWTPKAIDSYINVLKWLRTHWTDKEEQRFADNVERTIRYIVKYPRGFAVLAMHGCAKRPSSHTTFCSTALTPPPLSLLGCSIYAGTPRPWLLSNGDGGIYNSWD